MPRYSGSNSFRLLAEPARPRRPRLELRFLPASPFALAIRISKTKPSVGWLALPSGAARLLFREGGAVKNFFFRARPSKPLGFAADSRRPGVFPVKARGLLAIPPGHVNRKNAPSIPRSAQLPQMVQNQGQTDDSGRLR